MNEGIPPSRERQR